MGTLLDFAEPKKKRIISRVEHLHANQFFDCSDKHYYIGYWKQRNGSIKALNILTGKFERLENSFYILVDEL